MSKTPAGRSRRSFAVVGGVHAVNATIEPQLAVWWPVVQTGLFLSATELTALQLCLPFGLFAGASVGGRLAARFGTRIAFVIGAALFFAALPLVLKAPSFMLAALVLLVLGIGNGIYDVVQGTVTSGLEDTGGRRHTLAFKAVFSGVSFVAAVAAGFVVSAGVAPFDHLVATSVIATAIVLAVLLWQLPDIRPDAAPAVVTDAAEPKGLGRETLPLALLAAAAALPLGVMYTRGAFLFEALGATGGGRAIGLAVFSIAQAVVQLGVWWWSMRIRPRVAAVAGGWLAVGGSLLFGCAALGYGGWPLAAVGITALGAGLAAVSPMAQSDAGQRFPAQRARAIGSVVRLNHFGIAAAPGAVLLAGVPFGPTVGAAVVTLVCAGGVALSAGFVFRGR